MNKKLFGFFISLLNWTTSFVRCFSPLSYQRRWIEVAPSSMILKASGDPMEELSEERKANLFQFLLRDLQVEGVPLLEVDANQVHILQAALWTTLAEMSTQSEEQKACLIFESIPISVLRAFVDDFMICKAQDRLMSSLPELQRFHLSLVGKGIGPAILIEQAAQKDAEQFGNQIPIDSNRNSAAMKMFVDRMVAERQVSGYPTTGGSVPSTVEGVPVPAMSFTSCPYSEVCHILSFFWNSVCELMTSPGDLRSSMLILPGVDRNDVSRFVAVAELLSRSLCLYRMDDIFEILHFHPLYDRDTVFPDDRPAHGHIPPISWLKPMLQLNGSTAAAQTLSDDDMRLVNYLRRAPSTAVCIVPVDLWSAGLGPEDGVVTLEVNGMMQQASGVATYSKNVIDLTQQGERALQDTLTSETAIIM